MSEILDFEKEKKKIGERIREIRKNKGINQKQLAEMLSISQDSVSKIEQGKVSLSFEYQLIIAKAFNISHDFLCTGNVDAPLDTIKKYISFRYKKILLGEMPYIYPVLEINKGLYTFLTHCAKAEYDKTIPENIKKQWIEFEEEQFEKNIEKETTKPISIIPIPDSLIFSGSNDDTKFSMNLLRKINSLIEQQDLEDDE